MIPASRTLTRHLACLLAAAVLALPALAQSEPSALPCVASRSESSLYRTFYLTHATDQNSFIEIQTVLRNLLQEARINGIHSRNAIAVCGTPADLQLAQKIVADLDHERKTWRLTYTISSSGSSAPQRISMLVAAGERSELRQGNRVPLVTGNSGSSSAGQQVQYIDVGLGLTATLDGAGEGTAGALQLHTKIEQSTLSGDKSPLGSEDPVVRQTTFEGTATLTPARPQILGSIQPPGATEPEQISVTVEPAP